MSIFPKYKYFLSFEVGNCIPQKTPHIYPMYMTDIVPRRWPNIGQTVFSEYSGLIQASNEIKLQTNKIAQDKG